MIHSYSSLSTWRLCPRLHKAQYIDRSLKYEESPAMREGKAVHKRLEDALVARAPLPEGVQVKPALWQLLLTAEAQPEVRVAMTRDGGGCGFFDKDAWLRGAMDVYVGIPDKHAAVVIDWKTGAVRPVDPLQAEVYAAILHNSVHVRQVLFVFSYVKHGALEPVTVDAAKAAADVRRLAERVEADTEHAPRPGWKCRFCALTDCEYNQTR